MKQHKWRRDKRNLKIDAVGLQISRINYKSAKLERKLQVKENLRELKNKYNQFQIKRKQAKKELQKMNIVIESKAIELIPLCCVFA